MEGSLGIESGHREAIELEFGDIAEGLIAEEVADAAVEVAEFGFVECVVEAKHRRAVGKLEEALTGGTADAGAGRIETSQVGVFGLECEELAHQGIVLKVGDLGRIEDVVTVLVMLKLFAQIADAICG